jgi:hypothetical protein
MYNYLANFKSEQTIYWTVQKPRAKSYLEYFMNLVWV